MASKARKRATKRAWDRYKGHYRGSTRYDLGWAFALIDFKRPHRDSARRQVKAMLAEADWAMRLMDEAENDWTLAWGSGDRPDIEVRVE